MDEADDIRAYIRALAFQYGVAYQASQNDEIAQVASRLAGDDVVTDNVEDLIVALRRAKVISGEHMVELLSRYLQATHNT